MDKYMNATFTQEVVDDLKAGDYVYISGTIYTARDAASSIVEKNIYGLDIDDRAAQLAYFAVMMKARQYDRRIFTRGGMLERFMQRPLLLTDDQVYRLLQTAFNTEAVQTMEKALITEAVRAVTKAAEDTNPDAKA